MGRINTGSQTQSIQYNIIIILILSDLTGLRDNVHEVQNAKRLITYFMHGRRGLLISSYSYNYVQLISCTFSVII